MTLHILFDSDVTATERPRIKEAIEDAFESGAIQACQCPTVEVRVFETLAPDFQASISCACDVMRPLFSSTPEVEDEV